MISFRRLLRPFRLLPVMSLALGLLVGGGTLLTSTGTAQAQGSTRPVMATPWDAEPVITAGSSYSANLFLIESGPGSGNATYFCSGLPAGLTLDRETGAISGITRAIGYHTVSASVVVGGISSKVSVKRIAVKAAHIPAPGYYEKVIPPHEHMPLGAHFTVLLQPSGAYSGQVRVGTRTIPVGGHLRPDSAGQHGTSTAFPFRVISGPVMQGVFVTGAGYLDFQLRFPTALVSDVVATYHELTLVRSTIGQIFPMPSSVLGRHIVAFTEGRDHGAGFGSATVSADGRLTFAGQSPHGKSLTSSHWCVVRSESSISVEFYASDNATTAVLGADVMIPSADVKRGFGLTLAYSPRGALMNTFVLTRPVSLLTSRYTTPLALDIFPNGVGTLLLSAAGNPSIPPVSFELTRRLSTIFGFDIANPIKARLDLYAPTGIFSGQFTLRDADPRNESRTIVRNVRYQGVFLPEQHLALGYFLMPLLPEAPSRETAATTAAAPVSPIVSGAVRIVPDIDN